MPETVLIDELHLSLWRPPDLLENEVNAIRQTLGHDEFLTRLRRAIQATVDSYSELASVRVSLTR